MKYEFLKQFPKRMKVVGLYTILIKNSIAKTSWKEYGFEKADEEINLLFAVLLFVMEQSLKEEVCTIDDIAVFVDDICSSYFDKPQSYEDSKSLADFLINSILSNEGRMMSFMGYDFDEEQMQDISIAYIANKIIYTKYDVKRTSYYLTDDGYNLMLATLEIESNLKLTIQEMIFKLHLEKQSYEKAAVDIKEVFNLLRIQLQKINETMLKIKRNALAYSVKDYEQLLVDNLETITQTDSKFREYREYVHNQVLDFERSNIQVEKLSKKDEENLDNLRIIEDYLTRAIDEHQRILGGHFDLKSLYTKELEALSQMSLIRRFSIRNDFYEELFKNPGALEEMDIFLRPLFARSPEKIYNPNKALMPQLPLSKKADLSDEVIDFDDGLWEREREEALLRKKKRYEASLKLLMDSALKEGKSTLLEIIEALDDKKRNQLIPDVGVFKEIMVELLKAGSIDINLIKKERSKTLSDLGDDFNLGESLLDYLEAGGLNPDYIYVRRIMSDENVVIESVMCEDGILRTIRCSNVSISMETQNVI